MKATKVIAKTVRIAAVVLLALLLVYNVYIAVQRLVFKNAMPTGFGIGCATVVTGSMSPAIEEGDFIITKKQNSYKENDIVTFLEEESNVYITHRIIFADGNTYATKGDANNTADGLNVTNDNIVGKVVFVWHGFGKVVSFLQSPAGIFCLIAACAAIWIATDFFSKRSDKDETNDKKNTNS